MSSRAASGSASASPARSRSSRSFWCAMSRCPASMCPFRHRCSTSSAICNEIEDSPTFSSPTTWPLSRTWLAASPSCTLAGSWRSARPPPCTLGRACLTREPSCRRPYAPTRRLAASAWWWPTRARLRRRGRAAVRSIPCADTRARTQRARRDVRRSRRKAPATGWRASRKPARPTEPTLSRTLSYPVTSPFMAIPTSVDGDVLAAATDRPPALDDRALLGHPRGLGLLFLIEMWERFSYYGMRAILVLYLVHVLKWRDADADNLYGWYTMGAFLTPLFGGYLADRFIGTRRSLVVGGIVIASGHFVLALDTLTTFYIGLVLVVIGTGFFKPNVSTMVGQLYRPGDARRDAGFTIFYMGINLGGFFAQLVCGGLAQSPLVQRALRNSGLDPARSWSWGFAAAGVGMLLGLGL